VVRLTNQCGTEKHRFSQNLFKTQKALKSAVYEPPAGLGQTRNDFSPRMLQPEPGLVRCEVNPREKKKFFFSLITPTHIYDTNKYLTEPSYQYTTPDTLPCHLPSHLRFTVRPAGERKITLGSPSTAACLPNYGADACTRHQPTGIRAVAPGMMNYSQAEDGLTHSSTMLFSRLLFFRCTLPGRDSRENHPAGSPTRPDPEADNTSQGRKDAYTRESYLPGSPAPPAPEAEIRPGRNEGRRGCTSPVQEMTDPGVIRW
jgi:hypothetical protein